MLLHYLAVRALLLRVECLQESRFRFGVVGDRLRRQAADGGRRLGNPRLIVIGDRCLQALVRGAHVTMQRLLGVHRGGENGGRLLLL